MTLVYEQTHLDRLESESVHIFREVAATIERPALLFSGGKDSVVMLHLALKAFWPAPVPFPVMHVDTGQNFDEVIAYRDRTVEKHGLRLVVAHVQDDIDAGRAHEEFEGAARNRPAARQATPARATLHRAGAQEVSAVVRPAMDESLQPASLPARPARSIA